MSSPIAELDNYTVLTGLPLAKSASKTTYNNYGLPTDHKDCDWGNILKRELVYTYPTNLGNIKAFWQTITTKDGSGNVVAKTTNNFDETAVVATSGTPQHVSAGSTPRGNLTSVVQMTRGSATLTKRNTYFDTGKIQTATDVNGAQTTYTYGACGNSLPTKVSEPLSLSTSATWNCTGGVQTSTTDENGNISYTNYTTDHYFWRPESTKDTAGNVTTFTYTGQTQIESVLSFNSGASAVDTLTTLDSQGRKLLAQKRQAPGSSTFDSVETFYDSLGRAIGDSLPYSGTAGQTTTVGPSPKTTFDAYNRPTQITDNGGKNAQYIYDDNDVYEAIGPAPAGENWKRKQYEFDGLGRLTSVCEMSIYNGGGLCGQNSQEQGYWTKYTYDAQDNLTGVTQNAQSSTTQTRSYTFDGLSRLISEINPESGTTTYTYDSASNPCGWGQYNNPGTLIQKTDANGNSTCYQNDSLHRLTAIGNSNQTTANSVKRFFYDNSNGVIASRPSGVTVNNGLGRLVEAETDCCAWPVTQSNIITDEWFSYDANGNMTDVYEFTPHSGGYYHPAAAYWANGALRNLWISGLPSISYATDGEGRTSTVSASTGQNPVTATNYNAASQVTKTTFGSGDGDEFFYDSNTGRMTQYKLWANGSNTYGNLTWNANGTLKSLSITDPFNSADAQTCNYTHDDLVRVSSASCGSVWSQTFGYDSFGNITKSGSSAWMPGYNSSTNRYTLSGTSYDADGNLLSDTAHTYTWNVYGRPATIDSIGLTYDAFDRMVEQTQSSGAHSELVYAPTGQKLATFNGQALQLGFVPLPGGATAHYQSWGLGFYRHADWLGSSRLATSTSSVVEQDTAYAPFGEPYAIVSGGNGDYSFTGQNKDTVWLQYDFLFRQYDANQGRWISPDPAGVGAVDPSDPQTWNRYAYVRNSPLNNTDSQGLDCDDFGCDDGGFGWGGWDGNFGESLGIPTGINVVGSPGGSFNQCDFLECGTGSGGYDFISGTSGTANDPYTIQVIATCANTFNLAACLGLAGNSDVPLNDDAQKIFTMVGQMTGGTTKALNCITLGTTTAIPGVGKIAGAPSYPGISGVPFLKWGLGKLKALPELGSALEGFIEKITAPITVLNSAATTYQCYEDKSN